MLTHGEKIYSSNSCGTTSDAQAVACILQHEKACMRSILVDARPCNEPSAVADGAASVSELKRLSSRLRKPFVQARDYFADIG
ncbi:hypothetical protein T09_1241 [Trichinella sp. T9]|nr:hypothetical protein T09_1241 [Trichinella sp. T9]